MKTILKITLGLLITLFSCGKSSDKKILIWETKDSLKKIIVSNENEKKIKRKELEKQDKIDSLNLEKNLQNAILITQKHININTFKKEYNEIMPDSLYHIEISINSGFFFTKENSHVIIKRKTPGFTFVDIFSKTDKKINKVISLVEYNIMLVNDTIWDINGDGLKDFIFNWHGSSGCCLKYHSYVYLLQQDKKSFSNYIEFINPTFSPKEKIIRGVCYGNSGDTELYKYKWTGEKVDTLEYVFYEKNKDGVKTGKIIISPDRPYGKNNKVLKRLNYVPKEYHLIYGYDWFTGKDLSKLLNFNSTINIEGSQHFQLFFFCSV